MTSREEYHPVEMKRKREEEAKRIQEEKELEECTFAPNLNLKKNPERKVVELKVQKKKP